MTVTIKFPETIRRILTEDLEKRIISAKMVPRMLVDEQKQRRLDISSVLSFHLELFDRLITKHAYLFVRPL